MRWRRLIAEVWREVLRVERVGVHDNFFELGGHSLLATQVLARLARVLQIELSLHGFFESPTVSALAAAAQQRLAAGRARLPVGSSSGRTGSAHAAAEEALGIARRVAARAGICRCRLRSSGCGFSTGSCRATAPYNMPTAWRLQGPLDVGLLERSLGAVVARHESLRTRIVAA